MCDMQNLCGLRTDAYDLITSSIVNCLDDLERAFSTVFRVLGPRES